MGKRIQEWKREISRHKKLILLSLIFLVIAIILNHFSSEYLEKKTGVAVSDLILDNIPAVNLSILFYYGIVVIFAVGILYALFFRVPEVHRVIGQFSLLVMIRSFFLTLTHLGAPAGAVISNAPRMLDFLNLQNALFFSGHTATPFLLFLIFRKEKIKWFFLAATIIMMATVLLMHVHYSIDVFAALFITYGSYKIGEKIFRKINHY